jgi:hypothetical protein
MKRIHLLSEICTAAGADIEIVREFVARECTGEDRHSLFGPIEIPSAIADHADELLDPENDDFPDDPENQELLSELRRMATVAKKATDFMTAEGIDYFHDDLVCFAEED